MTVLKSILSNAFQVDDVLKTGKSGFWLTAFVSTSFYIHEFYDFNPGLALIGSLKRPTSCISRETLQHTEPCPVYIDGNITGHWTMPCIYRGKHHSTLNHACPVYIEGNITAHSTRPCIYGGKHHSTLNQVLYIYMEANITAHWTRPCIYGGKHHSTLNQALYIYIWRETSQYTEPCPVYIEGNITAHWTRPCLYRGKHHNTLNQALFI